MKVCMRNQQLSLGATCINTKHSRIKWHRLAVKVYRVICSSSEGILWQKDSWKAEQLEQPNAINPSHKKKQKLYYAQGELG